MSPDLFGLGDPAEPAEPPALRTTAEWRFLVTLNDHLRPLRCPVQIQEVATRLLGEHLGVNRVSYAEIDGDDFIVSRSYEEGVAPFVGRGPITAFGAALLETYRRGETVAVNDVRSDARFTDTEREYLLANDIAAFVGVMLHKEGRWLAAFCVHSATPRAWTSDQIALIEATGERSWAAAERAAAEGALRKSEERQAFLLELSDTIRPIGDPARILAEACRLLGTHLGVNRVVYAEVEGDECTVVNDYVDGVASMAGRVRWTDFAGSRADEIARGEILVVNDTATDPRTAPERQALQAAEIGAYLAPILIKDGRHVGGMGIHSRTPRVWTHDEITLVQDVADRIWATLAQRKAAAGLRASEERLFFLLRLNDALRQLSDPSEVQEATARLLGEHLQVNRVGYAEVDGSEYVIRREYARGVAPLVGRGPTGTFGAALRDAYRRGDVVIVNDVQTDPRFTEPERAAMHAREIAAFAGVTLIKGGRLVAAFGANNATPRVWTPAEIALIRDVAERTWEAVERARAEATLREREHRLRLALEASAAGSWTWDVRTNQVDWDAGFRVRYGFAPDEPASYDAWVARVHEEDRPRVLGLLTEMLTSTTRLAWDNSFRIVLPDGAVRWIQSLGCAERDANGQVTRLTGLELDITERRRAEEALQARRDEKRDRQLRLLLETAEQGIVLVDAKGFILTANRALEAMFGWATGELVGQPIERLLPASLRSAHMQHRTGYFKVPRSRPMGADIDLVGQRKDGSTFPIEVTLNHVATPDGGQAIAFVADITERRRVAEALRERTVELERRTAQLSQLASDLTLAEQRAREQLAKTLHDGLQQTLVLAALNLDQVKRDWQRGTPDEPLVQAKSYLDEAIVAARSLSFELFPPFLQSSGMPAALAWLADWTRNKHGLDVQVSADPLANTTRKDVRTLLFESVRELLLNAVKHAQVDRAAVDLVLDADDRLCITVTDEGIGFDPAGLDDPAKAGAIGWGLFSIRERLTLLGGRFDIESSPGRGTRFRLIAPRDGASGAAGVLDSLSYDAVGYESGVAATRASAHALRILIADDHTAVREVFREILHEHPELRVVGDASNGIEAIEQARALRPDVILMDISMPEMDGIEATQRLRAELPFITILGLSMHPRTHALHAIEQAGAEGFYTKGVDTQRLLDHLLVIHANLFGSDADVNYKAAGEA